MALDPRTLTPAAAKSLFLQQTAPRVGFPQNTSGMSMPQIDAGRGMSLGMFPETTQNQLLSDEAAKDVGQQIFGPRLDNADPDKLMTMATDDNNKVDPSVQDIHNENPEIAKILGAVVKLQNDTSSTELLASLVGEKTTPEAAKAEVQKFLWEKEIIQPYLEFEHINEGVVFTWKDKRYKITGAFTPINKINGFKLYKSNKIQFK